MSRPIEVLIALVLASGSSSSLRAQSVHGVVFDELENTPIEGATVRLLSEDLQPVDSVVTDALGRFALKPAPGTYSLVAESSGYGGAPAGPFVLKEGDAHSVMLPVRRLTSRIQVEERGPSEFGTRPGTARVLGRVTESATGRPIQGVELAFEPGGHRTLSDDNGYFAITDLPNGLYVLRAEHLAFATVDQDFLAEGGRSYEVRIRMDPEAIPLGGLVVTTRSTNWFKTMSGVRFRMGQDLGGVYITEDELDRRGNPSLSRMLRGRVRLRVIERPGWATVIVRGCGEPSLWIDGILVPSPIDINMVSGPDVELVEIYTGPATTPAEFSMGGGVCGAIVVWTRRGG